ncbi:MAG: hypothetical protein IPJ19_03585 [Planctomycetes bacterium]|nr:hypothetical protein [Planctomycetota bacterium]
MKRTLHLCCCAFLALFAGNSAFGWQSGVVDKLPKPFTGEATSNWTKEFHLERDPRTLENFTKLQAKYYEEGLYTALLQRVLEAARAKPWATHADVYRKAIAKIAAVADAFQASMASAVPDGSADTPQEFDALLAALNQRGFGIDEFAPREVGQDNPVWIYFDEAGHPEERLVLYKNLSTDLEEHYELLISVEEMIDLRLCFAVIHDVLTKTFARVRQQNVAQLDLAVERWANYLDNGYSQYPWESLVNGFVLDIPDLGPPDHQWILLHPALGIELSTDNFGDMHVKEALDLELLGFLKYTGKKYDNFYGGSLALSFRDDIGPGIGAVAHLGRNWNVGVSWHDTDDDGRYFDQAPYVFFSLDLYRFVGKQESKLSESMHRDLVRLPRAPGN